MNFETGQCERISYVRKNEKFNISNIPEGKYYLKIAAGLGWFEKKNGNNCYGKFVINPMYEKGKDTLNFYKNTYIDNQVHIAHNNKIGNNCIIAGQVVFAVSSTLGDNIMIGGQAGISGRLKIGNNVHIGGGSGVINDIPDNSKIMGYPATNLRNFLKGKK